MTIPSQSFEFILKYNQLFIVMPKFQSIFVAILVVYCSFTFINTPFILQSGFICLIDSRCQWQWTWLTLKMQLLSSYYFWIIHSHPFHSCQFFKSLPLSLSLLPCFPSFIKHLLRIYMSGTMLDVGNRWWINSLSPMKLFIDLTPFLPVYSKGHVQKIH